MADQYTASGVPVLRGVNVNQGRFYDDDFVFIDEKTADRLSKFESFPGDVLLVHKGTLGQIGLMPKNRKYPRYIMGNSMMRVRCDPSKLLPQYLYYWLSSAQGQHYLFSRVSQVGVPQIQRPLTTLRQATLAVPRVSEQQWITHILGTLDDKIELNRRMNKTLEAMARAIFKSWFVDFDPVCSKAEGRQPSGMDAATAALFPDSFEDSPLGEIPRDWRVASLADFALLNPEVWAKQNPPITIEYVDLSNVKWGGIEATTLHPWNEAPSRAQRVLRCGDTIVGTVRPGNGSYALISDDGLTGSTGFAVLRPRKSSFREIVYLAGTNPDNIERLAHLADGAAYPAVRPDAVQSTQIIVAPDPIVELFSQMVRPLLAKYAASNRESHALAATRDVLLPKLISGEIRVSVANKLMESIG